jgi:hypothetical protein
MPDIVNEEVLNHYDWYDAHNYDPKYPYPGETTIRLPTQFRNALARSLQGPSKKSPEAPANMADDDGDGL